MGRREWSDFDEISVLNKHPQTLDDYGVGFESPTHEWFVNLAPPALRFQELGFWHCAVGFG